MVAVQAIHTETLVLFCLLQRGWLSVLSACSLWQRRSGSWSLWWLPVLALQASPLPWLCTG